MPQLDPSTYPSQLFWLVLTFVPLFFILWKLALPKVSAVLEARRKHIESDLDQAARLKDEAAKVLADYEKAVAGAHERARADLRQVADEMAAQSAKRHAALAARLAEQIKDAETRIGAAKSEALTNIRAVAGDAAAAATERLIGVKVAAGEIEQAINAVAGEKR